jgi:hypothetical protein
MAQVDYKKIAEAVLGNTALKMEDLNVALFLRLIGEASPPGAPSTAPVKVGGMVDVANKFKPAIEVTLQDETGAPSAQKVRFYNGVKGGQDLVAHFDPAWVVQHMENADRADPRLGLLFRLVIGRAAMDSLREAMSAGKPVPADVVVQLKAARAGLDELMKKLAELAPPGP